MGQVSKYLRKTVQGHSHWCPGCSEMHILFDSWHFNGNVDKPTYTPSFKHTGLKRNIVDGAWVGEGKDAWLYDAAGNPIPKVCHYILTDGVLHFCADSTHTLAGKSVPLPELPLAYQDTEKGTL